MVNNSIEKEYIPKTSELRKLYCEFNERCFHSALPTCDIVIVDTPYYLGQYVCGRPNHYFSIHIARTPGMGIKHWTKSMLREVFLHEMVHAYVEEIIGRRLKMFGHAFKFRRECRRLRRDYGERVHVSVYPHVPPPTTLRGKLWRPFALLVDYIYLWLV